MAIRIKDWEKFQHFKDRTPPWVKLYRDILDDPDWHDLDGQAAKVLTMLWLIASEDDTHTGTLPDSRKLAFRLRLKEIELRHILGKLSHWLIQDDIAVISPRYQVDAPETERETEAEERQKSSSADDAGFESFWNAYPRKVGKGAAINAWKKAKPPIDAVLQAIRKARQSPDWLKERGAFIPHPATWLNQGRWEDEGMDYAALAGKRDLGASLAQESGIDEADAFRWRGEVYPESLQVHPSPATFPFRSWPDSIKSEYRNARKVAA